MDKDFNLDLKNKNLKIILLIFIYLLAFYFLIFKNILKLNEIKELVEQEDIKIGKLNYEKNVVLKALDIKRKDFEKDREKIEKQHKELLEFIQKEEYKDFKISSLLEELSYLCPNGAEISSIEYDENKIFNIEGSTGKIDNVVKFLENITNSKNFKLYNYDYILRKENEIKFKLEIKYF